MEVRTDHCSLENLATEDFKTVQGPSQRQARWHEPFPKLDLHVVYTPGPGNPVGDFVFRWAYPASPALGDVRDMMAAGEEELLVRLLVFWAIVAPVVTSKAAPRAPGAPVCDPPLQAAAPFGGGAKRKKSFENRSKLPR